MLGRRALLALALFLVLAAAPPAAAADVVVASRAPDPRSHPHIIYGAECNAYMDWQAVSLVYSARKAGYKGPMTRLLACSPEKLQNYTNVDIVPTHVTPSYTFNPHNKDRYAAYNKPGCIMHFMEHAPPKEEWILILDPDMQIRDTFEDWGRVYGADRGWAVSVFFNYMQGVSNNLSATHVPEVAPRKDAFAGPQGRRGDMVSAVVLMHRDDLRKVAPRWLHYSEVVRDDPSAWNETGDEYADRPGRKPWISEMYGYSFGASSSNVWHHVDYAAMLYPNHRPVDKPLILHWGRLVEFGNYRWQKHWWFGQNFQALKCPPWPHMSVEMTGKEAAAAVTGGLFPHPPHPREFANLPSVDRYTKLLSLSTITTINAALCERHLLNCPPSKELQQHCSKAKQLERDTDAAIKALESNTTEPLCVDRKPANKCIGWAKHGLCWQDTRFMHYWCRETCGLCRLPTGRPQPTFSWDGKPVNDSFAQKAGAASKTQPSTAQRNTEQPPGAAAVHSTHNRRAGRAEGFSSNEWYAVRASDEVVSAEEEEVATQCTVLLVGMFGWSILLCVSLGAVARGLWHRRHGASELPRRTGKPGSGMGAAFTSLLQHSWHSRTVVPFHLLALLALALILCGIKLTKLRAGSGPTSAHHQGTEETLPTARGHITFGVEYQLDGSEQQKQQHKQQQQALEPGACFKQFPWIQPALEQFYAPAWAVANASTQSTEEALEALRGVMWTTARGKYHPGMDEVVLSINPQSGRVEMSSSQVSPHGKEHKKTCVLGLLHDAVEAHNAELAALLQRRGGGKDLRLMVVTEDFGVTLRASKWKLPAFAMCTDNNRTDIPVPDYSYKCYPEARYTNSSWPSVQGLLQHKSNMVGWRERHPKLFHRSNWGVGPRRTLMPLLKSYINGSAGTSAVEAFGATLDIENTGFVQVNKGQAVQKHDDFVWLDGQCDYKYLIHTAGLTYSAGLKYKLACGSLVFKFSSPYVEFFEPALKDNVHVVVLPATREGVDLEQFKQSSAPRIKQVVQSTVNLHHQPPIAWAGQAFVREQLTADALHCYWLGALQRYADIYYLPRTQAQEVASGSGSAAVAGRQSAPVPSN